MTSYRQKHVVFAYPTLDRPQIWQSYLSNLRTMSGSQLLIREITFQLFQCVWSQSANVTDGHTDRRHTIAIPHTSISWTKWWHRWTTHVLFNVLLNNRPFHRKKPKGNWVLNFLLTYSAKMKHYLGYEFSTYEPTTLFMSIMVPRSAMDRGSVSHT